MTRSSLAPMRALVGEAYQADPMTTWIFADPDTRLAACAAWYGLFVEQYLDGRGRVEIETEGDALLGVALWRLPEDGPLDSSGVPGIASLLPALIGRRRSEEVGAALHGIGALRRPPSYAYVNFLAVAPGRQGSGVGARLLTRVLDRTGDLPTCLESANPRNRTFYRRAGFTVDEHLQLGAGGPELAAMSRAPDLRGS